jgi:predicted phosphohydrolase
VYAVSDLHTDYAENIELVRSWQARPADILIVAGDVSHEVETLKTTLQILASKYHTVFFCAGNHDLWLKEGDASQDSLAKLNKLYAICNELGVRTERATVRGVTIVPLQSWYHASFDADPDVDTGSKFPVKVENTLMDYHKCRWPKGLSARDSSDSLAKVCHWAGIVCWRVHRWRST